MSPSFKLASVLLSVAIVTACGGGGGGGGSDDDALPYMIISACTKA